MTQARQQLGEQGEKIAEQWLTSRGWTVLERRFRSGHRDVDLIVAKKESAGRLVAFVEVKARKSSAFGGPLGAISWKKQRELYRSASIWMARHGRKDDLFRFDVIGLLIEPARVRVQHVENAFLIAARS